MAKFTDIMQLYSQVDQIKILSALSKWEGHSFKGKVVSRNIINEQFLKKDSFKNLLSVILTFGEDPAVLEKVFDPTCNNLKRKGERISLKLQPGIIGRAVNRSVFETWLFGKYEITEFDSPSQVTAFIDRVIAGSVLEEREKKMLMNYWIAWVTWDETGGAFPFSFLRTNNPNEVISHLGTDLKFKNEPILLLTYHRKPKSLYLHKATVADAGTYYQFDPVISSSKLYGRTRPWHLDVFFNKGEYDPTNPPWDPKPQPEGVHDKCSFEVLISISEIPD